jgi:hypothetical protein
MTDETRAERAEWAAREVADWRVDEAQMGRIAALLRTDPATSRPEQDRGVDPLAS